MEVHNNLTDTKIIFNLSDHNYYIPAAKYLMDMDSLSEPSMKTRTHSQAPARKRTRKGSWGKFEAVTYREKAR